MKWRTAVVGLALWLSNGPAIGASSDLSFWREPGEPGDAALQKAQCWRLALRGPQAEAVQISGAAVAATRSPAEGGSVWAWKAAVGGQEAGVEMTFKREGTAPLTRWSLHARMPAGWTVTRADVLLFPLIQNEAGLKMAVPFGWGLEYDVRPGMSYEGVYPSLVLFSPFVAFYKDGRGLYVGVHDAKGHQKRLSVKSGPDGASVTWTYWPGQAETVNGEYTLPADVVVEAFDGDYLAAAGIHREFIAQTPWGSGGSMAERPVPQWLKDTDLWLMPGPEPLKNVEACKQAGEFFRVPIALHWYNWHQIPFDTLYPEYLPPKEHFKEGVQALQAAGFHVMPYINGRLCDPKSKTWIDEHADRSAARKEDGGFYTEVYGSKVPLNVMCPATSQWQAKIGGIVERLVNEYGVDGVYIDQIGAAAAMRCYATDHGHSPGGGTFWVDGYREMLRQIRAKLPADRILTTEENAECWNDQLDALLLVNTPVSSDRRVIPLMPAVYSERTITFGFQYIAGEDLKRSWPFRAKMARDFIWGAQLGWVNVDAIMADESRREAEFLRSLARCRRGAHDLFVGGRFLGEMEATGDNPRLRIEGQAAHGDAKYAFELPAVLAAAWSGEGVAGVVAVNLSDAAHQVTLKVPAGLVPPGAKAEAFGAAGPAEADVSAAGEIRMNIPPREGRVVKLLATKQ